MPQQINLEHCAFDFASVVKLWSRINSSIADANYKEKILFLGGTGVGKSTLIDYLCGCRYEITRVGLKIEGLLLKNSKPEVCRTNNSICSETLYSQVVDFKHPRTVYCDLPGQHDTRGPEARIIAASGIHRLARLHGGVNAIVVVFEASQFGSDRSEQFKQTMQSLYELLQHNSELLNNVCYVVTKTSAEHTVDAFIENQIKRSLEANH